MPAMLSDDQYWVEIEYVSYDGPSRCYFYAIRVHRNKQVSRVKRRRFREFVQLHFALNPSQPLPSKYFATSPEQRKPQLERYLNVLLQNDLKRTGGIKICSPELERFLGLDDPNAFPPAPLSLADFERANERTPEERKARLAAAILLGTICSFLAFHVALYISADFPAALAAFVATAIISVVTIHVFTRWSYERKRSEFLQLQRLRATGFQVEHRPVDDLSITKAEADNLPILRERLVDFVTATTPEYDEQYIRNHGLVCAGLNGTASPPNMASEEAKEYRKLVWDRNVMVDHRLVTFLRFNHNSVDKAESQARFALTTHVALKMDTIQKTFTPPENFFNYATSPLLKRLSMSNCDELRSRRINEWWLRDRDGSLCVFARLDHMASGALFDIGCNRDPDLLNKTMIWFVEMFRADMDQVHLATKGKSPAACTVVVDMAGFDLAVQLATADVLNLVKTYVPLVSPCYGGMLKRYIVINAPWYVNMLLNIVRPFIPKDVLDSVRIHSGFDLDKMIRPFVEDKYIPKYLGGQLVGENGDPYCRDRLPPFGPFESDKGISLLKPTSS